MREARGGALNELREQALSIHVGQSGVATPAAAIGIQCALEVLLLALEVADDVLAGWTNESYALGKQFKMANMQIAVGRPEGDIDRR